MLFFWQECRDKAQCLEELVKLSSQPVCINFSGVFCSCFLQKPFIIFQ